QGSPSPHPQNHDWLPLKRLFLEAGLQSPGTLKLFSLFAGPSIVTPPKDIWNVTGAQIYLSCEVIGIPTPVLIWNKIIRGQYGVQRMELLPGDRENLAIQTRGGPEKHEVTGWVLVSTLCVHRAAQAAECSLQTACGQRTGQQTNGNRQGIWRKTCVS
uniref:Insulin like growth factor binding protein 7 n=1 Tax=Serinus canaria TaxID=9135 RepID=A0A8C9NI27_SERCA